MPGSEINGTGHSIVIVDGGSVNGLIQLSHQATLDMSGGSVAFAISLNGSETSWISGGETRSVVVGGVGRLFFSGGTILPLNDKGDLSVNSQAYVEMSGGTVGDDVDATQFCTVVITGGSIGGQLLALGSSAVYVYGVGFNFPSGEIAANSGTLTGILLDGTPINVDFGRASTAVIFLPELSASTALGSGIAMLALLYRRRGGCSFRVATFAP